MVPRRSLVPILTAAILICLVAYLIIDWLVWPLNNLLLLP